MKTITAIIEIEERSPNTLAHYQHIIDNDTKHRPYRVTLQEVLPTTG